MAKPNRHRLELYSGRPNGYATLFYKDSTTTSPRRWNARTGTATSTPLPAPPTNNLDKGIIRGFEFGYSQFFDFLPGWLSGFGVQANYTFVDSKGGTNAIVDPYETDVRTAPVDLPLEGLSRRSYNVVGVYEKNRLSFRLAYNLGSRYLLTPAT